MTNYLINSPISPEIVAEKIREENLKAFPGGFSVFYGQVRNDQIENKYVSSIVYSCYEQMANKEIETIINSISQKYYDIKSITILHSIGEVKVGEISLFVMISSGHRKQAFEALPELVDLIKANVPIWGKEMFEDKTYVWKK
ncbi:MAG: molybdenum cofactor biosynthesis protein MoaE [Bacteroidetes bacterium]|jgi:molybdopterin synthase catalytic subunit|nr:molybdenum cofactor biosynthesis protein MoaE [Bacteroidota bacterium]MBT6685382.1 molybdenum cofactor biosynthesis protein MoaE [Bacteroidota bacterium]MBT7145038.1 molybdenum cofactor biosynthesis protein MoaE [Bacteroidota bacterium]MBT7492723.1 molybdenum cofactor biosynthesis protein MoaE [Bacteroidota bacterium]